MGLELAGFQRRVTKWFRACFPPAVCDDMQERGDRFLEESLELLQSHSYDLSRVATLVDYVRDRPSGDPKQEVGGVMVTLTAYCVVAGIDVVDEAWTELRRIEDPAVTEKIRLKQASKRDIHGPRP